MTLHTRCSFENREKAIEVQCNHIKIVYNMIMVQLQLKHTLWHVL